MKTIFCGFVWYDYFFHVKSSPIVQQQINTFTVTDTFE